MRGGKGKVIQTRKKKHHIFHSVGFSFSTTKNAQVHFSSRRQTAPRQLAHQAGRPATCQGKKSRRIEGLTRGGKYPPARTGRGNKEDVSFLPFFLSALATEHQKSLRRPVFPHSTDVTLSCGVSMFNVYASLRLFQTFITTSRFPTRLRPTIPHPQPTVRNSKNTVMETKDSPQPSLGNIISNRPSTRRP